MPRPALEAEEPEVDPQPFVEAAARPWRAFFARVGSRWEAPRSALYSGSEARVCGVRSGDEAVALYCPEERRIHFELQETALMSRDEFWLVVAHEIGHHVQELSGTF